VPPVQPLDDRLHQARLQFTLPRIGGRQAERRRDLQPIELAVFGAASQLVDDVIRFADAERKGDAQVAPSLLDDGVDDFGGVGEGLDG
jgi:hypothetical protein